MPFLRWDRMCFSVFASSCIEEALWLPKVSYISAEGVLYLCRRCPISLPEMSYIFDGDVRCFVRSRGCGFFPASFVLGCMACDRVSMCVTSKVASNKGNGEANGMRDAVFLTKLGVLCAMRASWRYAKVSFTPRLMLPTATRTTLAMCCEPIIYRGWVAEVAVFRQKKVFPYT